MRRLTSLMATGLCLAATASPLAAQTFDESDRRLDIAGIAPAACVMRPPATTAGVNTSFDPTGPASGEVRIIQLVRPDNAEPMPASIELALPVICNASHRIAVRSLNGGLLRERGNARNRQSRTGFGEFLAYDLSLSWAGQQRTASSETVQNLLIDAPRGAAGDARLSFALPGAGGPLVAGRYADAIIVEFQVAN